MSFDPDVDYATLDEHSMKDPQAVASSFSADAQRGPTSKRRFTKQELAKRKKAPRSGEHLSPEGASGQSATTKGKGKGKAMDGILKGKGNSKGKAKGFGKAGGKTTATADALGGKKGKGKGGNQGGKSNGKGGGKGKSQRK